MIDPQRFAVPRVLPSRAAAGRSREAQAQAQQTCRRADVQACRRAGFQTRRCAEAHMLRGTDVQKCRRSEAVSCCPPPPAAGEACTSRMFGPTCGSRAQQRGSGSGTTEVQAFKLADAQRRTCSEAEMCRSAGLQKLSCAARPQPHRGALGRTVGQTAGEVREGTKSEPGNQRCPTLADVQKYRHSEALPGSC